MSTQFLPKLCNREFIHLLIRAGSRPGVPVQRLNGPILSDQEKMKLQMLKSVFIVLKFSPLLVFNRSCEVLIQSKQVFCRNNLRGTSAHNLGVGIKPKVPGRLQHINKEDFYTV